MAVARCEVCGIEGKLKRRYTSNHHPVSHPNSGIVCGYSVCHRPALIWLTREEEEQYQVGERVFLMNSNVVKVRLR